MCCPACSTAGLSRNTFFILLKIVAFVCLAALLIDLMSPAGRPSMAVQEKKRVLSQWPIHC